MALSLFKHAIYGTLTYQQGDSNWSAIETQVNITQNQLSFLLTLHKPDATVNPTVNDDASMGFGLFSKWYNVTDGTLFTLIDPTIGAAVWEPTASGLIGLGEAMLGYTPANQNGDTFTGPIITAASTGIVPGFILTKNSAAVTSWADGGIGFDGDNLLLWTESHDLVEFYHSGNLMAVTQEDAEDGTDTSATLWTAERVRQAIDALTPPQSTPMPNWYGNRALVTGTGTWTVPAGVSSVRVYAFGKGGNGAAGVSSGSSGGGGGGGGGCAYGNLAVTPGEDLSITIDGTSSRVAYDSITRWTGNVGGNASGTTAGTGGTASIHGSVTGGGTATGGAGGAGSTVTTSAADGHASGGGGGASGSPIGTGGVGGAGAANATLQRSGGGGGGWGGAGAASGGGTGTAGAGGGAGGAANAQRGGGSGGAATSTYPGPIRDAMSLFSDPITAICTGGGGTSLNPYAYPGPGGGGGHSGSDAVSGTECTVGGFGAGGAGVVDSETFPLVGKGGFGGGGGGGGHSTNTTGVGAGIRSGRTSVAAGGGGGGSGRHTGTAGSGGAGGPGVVVIMW